MVFRAVTPFWNDASTLLMSVASALPYVDEVVLVEGAWERAGDYDSTGASRDGSREIAERIQRRFPDRVRILGPQVWPEERACRNAALELGKEGDWWLVLDGDEQLVVEPNVKNATELKKVLDWFEGSPYLKVARTVCGDLTTPHYQTRFLKDRGNLRFTWAHTRIRNGYCEEYPLHSCPEPVVPGVAILDWGMLQPAERLKQRHHYQRTILPKIERRPA